MLATDLICQLILSQRPHVRKLIVKLQTNAVCCNSFIDIINDLPNIILRTEIEI